MYRVNCFTNLDDCANEEWPPEFVCRPRVGDTVQAVSGRALKIVQIIHCVRPDGGSPRIHAGIPRIYLSVELHKL